MASPSLEDNTTEDLRQVWGNFVDEVGDRRGGWDWFVTLTYRNREPVYRDYVEKSGLLYEGKTHKILERPGWDKPGWGYTETACNRFLEAVRDKKGLGDYYWFRAREYQRWRGVPHWHLLVGGVEDVRRMDLVDWSFNKYGIARILPYDKQLGARFYLCKYVTKELGDVKFSQNLMS